SAGNVPVYVKITFNITQAAHDIVMSKSFDNGIVCASESAASIDKENYKEFVDEIKTYHTYGVSTKETTLLEKYVFGATANSSDTKNAKLNPDVVGMDAIDIAKK